MTITREQYYALTGLLTLARQHNAALDTIKNAAAQITGELDSDMGHTADAVYSGDSADELLEKLEITVED